MLRARFLPAALAALLAAAPPAALPGRAAEMLNPLLRAVPEARFAEPYRRGLTALAEGRPEAAETAFREAAAAAPESFMPLLGLADALWRQGKREPAAEALRQAMAVAPDSRAPRQAWARFLAASGQIDEAIAAYRALIEGDAEAVSARIDLADLLVTVKRDPAAAEPLYRAALAREPDHGGARYALGNALMLLGRLDEARQEIRTAMAASPGNPLPPYLLGQVELRAGAPDAALAAFDQAIAAAPRFMPGHLARGDVLLARRDGAAAREAFRRALEIVPESVPALIGLGQANQVLGETAEAEEAYRRALARDPDAAIALNNLAWLLAEQGRDLPQAEAWARRAVALVPARPEMRATLGWVQRARGDLAGAAASLEEAARLGATPAILVQLGAVYLDLGRRAAAAAAADRALALDPAFEPAHALKRSAGL
jgi:tetratricopeptide (TPR) repeat protein